MKHVLRVAVIAATALSFTAAAERLPPRPKALPDSATARVIVKFKDGASLARAHALAASDSPQDRAARLEARAQSLGARHGMALRSGASVAGAQVMHGPAGMSSAELAQRLAADAEVAYAEPDRLMRRARVPDDTLFAAVSGSQGPAVGQWYLRAPAGDVRSAINAVGAWDTTQGSADVIVAVLDTGVRTTHPDLAGKLVAGYDFVSDPQISNDRDGRDADPSDPGDWVTAQEAAAAPFFDPDPDKACQAELSSWHGTIVSGLVGAATDNGSGMAGAGWNVRVQPVRVLGKCFGYTSDIVSGMRWAAGLTEAGVPANATPAKVINLSLGGGGACGPTYREAVAAINARGAVVVAAAGNTAGLAANSPANCPGVIGVAALRHIGSKVGFSDVGPELSIAAPGGNCINRDDEPCLYPLLSTTDTGTTSPVGPTYTDSLNASVGTSFSSPLVAATAALMFAANPALSAAELKAAMLAAARPFPASGLTDTTTGAPLPACRAPDASEQLECYCTTTTCGAGMLDAGAAVAAALAVVPTPTPDSGGGGGAMSAAWLFALALAALALRRGQRRRR